MKPAADENLDELLMKLETTISLLAGGTAPLDELVAAHERALRLLEAAQARLTELKSRATKTAESLAQ